MSGQLRPVGIAGMGSAYPDRVLTNADLEQMVDTSDEWIRTRTGILERRIAGPDETCSTFAIAAARKALEHAKIDPSEVDLIIVGTVTPDMPFPTVSCMIQDALGCTRAAAMDISAACPGFIYGVTTGAQFVATGMYDTVLVVGAEVLSKITDYTDRNTCVLFGDAAGAAVLRPAREGRGLLASVLGAEGSGGQHLYLAGGGSKHPASHETVDQKLHYLRMNGQEVFKFAVRVMTDSTQKVLEKSGYSLADLDLLVPHQANLRIIDAATKRLDVPGDKVLVNLDRFGNTSTATIPVALDEAVSAGRIKDGDLMVLVSFGAGLVWGAVAVRWGL